MTTSALPQNPYDGKAFILTTPKADDEGRYLAGYLTPADFSLPPRKITGPQHGYRYTLLDGSGAEVQGPWVGPEIDAFYAATGGCSASNGQPAVAPAPGFVPASILQPIVPIIGGPNAGPDVIVKPVVLESNMPAPDPAATSTTQVPSAVPVGAPLPAQHVAVHESAVQRAIAIGKQLENGVETGVRDAGRELQGLFAKLRSHR